MQKLCCVQELGVFTAASTNQTARWKKRHCNASCGPVHVQGGVPHPAAPPLWREHTMSWSEDLHAAEAAVQQSALLLVYLKQVAPVPAHPTNTGPGLPPCAWQWMGGWTAESSHAIHPSTSRRAFM